jgi:pectin methylesterase-like acyl-CoA thioesterase
LKALALLAWLAVAAGAAGEAGAQARPQLDAAAAAPHETAHYLDAGPQPWRPQALRDAAQWRADFVVAADGSGTHRTLQAAIDALPARGASERRHYIRVAPGSYREVVCARDKAPFTLYGTPGDPSAALIVEGRYNGLPKRAGEPANPCEPNLAATSYGTSGSASVAIFSDDVQLAHLTIANDATEPATAARVPTQGTQAVALMTRGDRIQLEDMRLFSHQDTFYVRAPAADAAARVYVHASLVAGDVDFVFGDATLVLDRSVLYSRADRRGAESTGIVLAPSTMPARSAAPGTAALRPAPGSPACRPTVRPWCATANSVRISEAGSHRPHAARSRARATRRTASPSSATACWRAKHCRPPCRAPTARARCWAPAMAGPPRKAVHAAAPMRRQRM